MQKAFTQETDTWLIEHPEHWPHRPILPLVRHARPPGNYWDEVEFPEVGWILDHPDWPNSLVFRDNTLLLEEVKSGEITLREIKRTVYSSVDAMLLAGWEVDRKQGLS